MCFCFNTQLQLTIQGEKEITLQFGEAYNDPGAEAVLLSTVFGDKNIEVQASSDPQLDLSKLGTYTVTYTGKYMWFHAQAQRTIHIVDAEAPVIVLKYDGGSFTMPGEEYKEEGFVAEDNYDGDITDKVQREVKDDVVYYTVTDSSGNVTEVQRPIKYGDITAPELKLEGETTITIKAGEKFTEPGYTAIDNVDGDITENVTVSNEHNANKAGTYTITYTVSDSFGNSATATRTLIVEAAKQPETVTPEGATIYLTFDDGPGPYTRQLLDVLKKYDVKATFFVCDRGQYNKLMKDIVDEGHSIAIHSKTHEYGEIYASDDAFFADLNAMSDIIYKNSGVRTTLMRFPGGSSNAISKKYSAGIMTRLTKAVQDQGYQYFDWNVDSNDAGGAKTADEVYNNVTKGCSGRKTSVVLQHDIHKYSVDAVERIIQWGLANGFTFRALDPTSPGAHHGVNN